ncbi:MAG: glycoside hydrolase [Bacteroidales bacterium]|nr:glycoside hydrolase [Bacteroidales bacterium]
MKKLFAISAACCLLVACGGNSSKKTVPPEDPLEGMTLHEKVSAMFWVRPESLEPAFVWQSNDDLVANGLREVTDTMRATVAEYPVGGVILFAHNIQDMEQLTALVDSLKALPGHPLICIDEEGGRVARIANNTAFGLPRYKSMADLASKGKGAVKEAAGTIGKYLHGFGIDIDFAPVADVNTNPRNIVIGPRAFSDNPEEAADLVATYLKALQAQGVHGCLKHFPGHGDTSADTHFGYAVSGKTWEEMLQCEMVPFRAGIAAGARLVMTAHISAPKVTGDLTPSTLSPVVLEEKLRGELGFEGVIVTDAMEMGAITRQFTAVEASVLAVKAGADVLLCVKDYRAAVDAVERAVLAGEIPESRIDQSVRRILKLKD